MTFTEIIIGNAGHLSRIAHLEDTHQKTSKFHIRPEMHVIRCMLASIGVTKCPSRNLHHYFCREIRTSVLLTIILEETT